MIKICENCKEEFNASRSVKRFCGQDCSVEFRQKNSKPKVKAICNNDLCGIEFIVGSGSKGLYCSKSCSAQVNNRTSPKRSLENICANEACGIACYSNRKYCSNECLEACRPELTKCSLCDSDRMDYGNLCREHYNLKMKDYVSARYYRLRAEWIEKLGGKCVICGTIYNLEFDHKNAKEKEFDIGSILATHSFEKVSYEMAKCQLLCEEHHLEKTLREEDIAQVPHGVGLSGKKNCRCELCRERKNEYQRNWKKNKIK